MKNTEPALSIRVTKGDWNTARRRVNDDKRNPLHRCVVARALKRTTKKDWVFNGHTAYINSEYGPHLEADRLGKKLANAFDLNIEQTKDLLLPVTIHFYER